MDNSAEQPVSDFLCNYRYSLKTANVGTHPGLRGAWAGDPAQDSDNSEKSVHEHGHILKLPGFIREARIQRLTLAQPGLFSPFVYGLQFLPGLTFLFKIHPTARRRLPL